MIRTIHLHGSLSDNGTQQDIELDVDTPYLLFRGLASQVTGFEERLRNCGTSIRVLKMDSEEASYLSPTDYTLNLGNAKEIHIVSEVEGGGLEAALIAAGWSTFAAGIAVAVVNMAISMVLGAIASALAPKPDTSAGSQQADQKPSFLYRGVVNVTQQGYPVPLAYGLKVLTGSTVISVDADTVQI